MRQPLDAPGRRELAGALGDSPWTATAIHLLRRGQCTAYVEGDPGSFTAAVVVWTFRPDEAMAFGTDAASMRRLLREIPGWRVINADETAAYDLGAVMERELGQSVRYDGDEYHVLTEPPNEYAHPLVRRLTIEDIALIEEAPPFLQQGRLFGGPAGLLREGIIAGAIESGRLVATAHTATMSEHYADVGVATLEPYRRQGIAAAAASLVCRATQALGRTPVWSCSEGNRASLRVAGKVGFTPIGRRINVAAIASPTQALQPTGCCPHGEARTSPADGRRTRRH